MQFKLIYLIVLFFIIASCGDNEKTTSETCSENVNYQDRQWYLNPYQDSTQTYGLNYVEQPTDFEVNIALVSDGLNYKHCDLAGQLLPDLHINFYNQSKIPSLSAEYMKRGTLMAGLIVGLDDTQGIKGVAPRSKLAFVNLINSRSDQNEADAMTKNSDQYQVSINNWSSDPYDKGFIVSNNKWITSVSENNREVSYVFGAGQSGQLNDEESSRPKRDSNLNAYTNIHRVMAVCAVDSSGKFPAYGVTGSNLLVCAPSSGSKPIIATDVLGDDGYNGDKTNKDYTDRDGFIYPTDVSTALAGGAIASLSSQLSSVPDGNTQRLHWRDIRVILAETAVRNDPADSSWTQGSAKISDPTQNYWHSEKYGFGVINLQAAIELAKSWKSISVSPYVNREYSASVEPADYGAASIIRSIIEVPADENLTKIEFIEVEVTTTTAGDLNDAQIKLVPPPSVGNVPSVLLPSDVANKLIEEDPEFKFPLRWKFGTVRNIGSNPPGVWTLMVSPATVGKTPKFSGWTIKFYGRGGG